MNRTLKLLIASDTLVFLGFGLISPILAIYVKDNVIGGSLAAVGIMTTIFLITKTIFQLLFSKVFEPKHRFYMVCVGTLLIASVPFIYFFSTQVWHFYLAQILYGLGGGLAYPAWFSLFSSNLTKGKQGFEWSVYSGLVGGGAGIAAFLGSILATKLGFSPTFFIAGALALMGMIILLGLERNNLKKILPSEMFVSKHKPSHH
jgi:MFS family permease